MKDIIVFDTSYGTQNLGDFIIKEAFDRELKYIFDGNYVTRFSTHTPIARWYQLLKPGIVLKKCRQAKLKFLAGTNLFKSSLIKINSDWNVDALSIPYYKNSIAVGCGMEHNSKKINSYTKNVYKKMLSKDYIHSTRDEKTKQFLESLGLKAINTGCPTMWNLTEELCKKIPQKKSNNVVFTLTDYKKDEKKDQKLIEILEKNYDKIYFWIQGSNDYEYLKSLKCKKEIIFINPTLDDYSKLLEKEDVDYIGTRLHAGIYAMNKCKRSIILSIDNRARDISETYKLKCVSREMVEVLDELIQSEFKTDVKINQVNIEKWKEQFKNI